MTNETEKHREHTEHVKDLEYSYDTQRLVGDLIGRNKWHWGQTIGYGNREVHEAELPTVVRPVGNVHRFLPKPEPKVRPATLEEAILMIEALPSALRTLKSRENLIAADGKTILGHDIRADQAMAPTLAERLIEEVAKRVESADQISHLFQMRDSLTAEGLIYKK